jgi:hypothetical protein
VKFCLDGPFGPSGLGSPNKLVMTPSETPAPSEIPERSRAQTEVPQRILDPILKKAAKLAKVLLEQLVIVRAVAVVWNDGSLGCPQSGMQFTQALVSGYWVVIKAAEQTYDFRVSREGNFRLCPERRGHPPSQSDGR